MLEAIEVATFQKANRSALANRPALHGLDLRSREGRAVRDLTLELLEPHGGADAPTRAKLLARACARCQIELARLEALESSNVSVAIDRAADIGEAARKLGIAFRRLDSLLADESRAEKPSNSLDAYLRSKAEQTA